MSNKIFAAALLLTATALLAGCLPDRRKDLDLCQSEADRFYQGYQSFEVNNPRSKYIIGCMADKGYTFNFTPANCDSRLPLPIQPTCYASKNWLFRFIELYGPEGRTAPAGKNRSQIDQQRPKLSIFTWR